MTNPLSDATGLSRIIPSSGWRIYTVADSMPTFDPATWRLRIDGLVEPADRALLRRAARAAEGRAGLDLPLRDRLDRRRTSAGAASASTTCSARRGPLPQAQRAALRLGREALRRLPRAAPGRASRRDARLRDGRQAAPPRARRARARRDPGDVRLQERQVGRADRRSSRSRARATGSSAATTSTPGSGARTAMASATYAARPRPRYVERFTLTERLLHWVHASAFFVLLGSGLVLYLPSLSTAVARRPLIKDIHFWTGDLLGGGDPPDRRARQPARRRADGPRDRPLRPRRRPLPRRRHSIARRAASTPARR